MDDNVEAAIAAVSLTDSEREKWFTAVCEATRRVLDTDPGAAWNSLSPALDGGLRGAGFPSGTVETFLRYLDSDSSRAPEVLRAMAEHGPAELSTAHQRLTSQPAQPAAAQTDPERYDPGQWNAFLVECGPRWNGNEGDWSAFRAWFSYTAEQRGLGSAADAFLGYIESSADKIAAFAAYQITIARGTATTAATTATAPAETAPAVVSDVSTFPDLTTGASGAWVNYLDTMLQRNGF